MVPTESHILTESVIGTEIALRGWCWGQCQSQTQGLNLPPFSQWRLCWQNHCPKPVFISPNAQRSAFQTSLIMSTDPTAIFCHTECEHPSQWWVWAQAEHVGQQGKDPERWTTFCWPWLHCQWSKLRYNFYAKTNKWNLNVAKKNLWRNYRFSQALCCGKRCLGLPHRLRLVTEEMLLKPTWTYRRSVSLTPWMRLLQTSSARWLPPKRTYKCVWKAGMLC